MTDIVNKATRSRMMAGIKSKNTIPEVFLRKALHAQGFRYRLGGGGLPGKPDLIFPAKRTVIFVNGCFWHCHECKYFKFPSSNIDFWREKLRKNVVRDIRVAEDLKKSGWNVLTVWECELRESGYRLPNSKISEISEILRNT